MATETWTMWQNSAPRQSRRDQTPILEVGSGDYYLRIHNVADWSGLESQD